MKSAIAEHIEITAGVLADVYAALAYYHDHLEEIRQQLAQHIEFL